MSDEAPPTRRRASTESAHDAFRVDALSRALRHGAGVDDGEFDRLYPPVYRSISSLHWTPIDVARRAAELLVRSPACNILDVGAGVGKFCIIGALCTGAHFTGIEQRLHLVDVARRTARYCGATRATFVHGDIRDVSWQRFDAVYLFNPFGENLFGESERIDGVPMFSNDRYERDTAFVVAQLERFRPGIRVATYHGIGTELPAGFTAIHRESIGSDTLEIWEKSGPATG